MKRRMLALFLALCVAATSLTLLVAVSVAPAQGLTAFRSYSELTSYLDRVVGQGYASFRSGQGGLLTGPAAPGAGGEYSGTNVQVAGIDELDTVKTDGSYLYLAGDRDVAIVRAIPASDLAVVARVPAAVTSNATVNVSAAQVTGLFVVGQKLIVVASSGYSYPIDYVRGAPSSPVVGAPVLIAPWGGTGGDTLVSVYGVEDPAHPRLLRTYEVSGSPVTGRLIPPFVYLVINQPVVKVNDTYVIPSTCDGGGCEALPPESIRYDPSANEAGSFTNLFAFDADTGVADLVSVVTGYASTVYVSFESLYLTYTKWNEGPVDPVLFGIATPPTSVWTTIHKVRLAGITMEPVAHSDVPGTLLNQFSLDEKDGYLRVFTTVLQWSENTFSQDNGLYVLDGGLAQVGRIEHIAPGENIHSARFLGDRAYLVTFQKIDPLFVIDVSVPTAPKILGELKIPGYSDYLHPIDEDHLLGIGKDTTNATEGDFSWYQGLKIALFNVSDVANPVQMSQYIIGDRGTGSDVLSDHKAFLSIPARGLAVIPVDLAIIKASQYPDPLPPWAYGEIVWQGAYVLSVDLAGGIGLHGRVTHQNATADAYPGANLDYRYAIHRSLYIGDVLYTISQAMVKANALADLSELASIVYA
ncbi:MAG TPA: beta-propeller domain-containing protein [Thermoplasmata archaeon]|nr:beta-propeller domain-containing protein [Thermoplasmata archaeon]